MKNQANYWVRNSLLLFVAAYSRWAAAQFVEIRSEVELRCCRSEKLKEQTKPRVISGVCITGPAVWRIEDDGIQGGMNKWFYDGTNVYESLQATAPLPPEIQQRMERAGGPATVPFEIAKTNLTINIWPSSDGHPLADDVVNLQWLAFCSSTYLKRDGRLIPLPCEILRHTPDRYAYTDRTEVFSEAAGLPRSVDLLMSRPLYLTSVADFYKGWGEHYLGWMNRAVTNVQEGALTFHYSVTATTNFLGRTFPLRFEFYQKGRPFLQNEDWYKEGVGTLKSIRIVPAPEGLFNPSLQQTVADQRFHDEASGVNGIMYTWAKESTPDANDPALLDKLKKQAEQALRRRAAAK